MKKNTLVLVFLLIISFGSVSANNNSANNSSANSNPGLPSKSNGRAHNILSNKLPVRLLSEVKKAYKTYWITDLYQQGDKRHPSYTITVENADRVIEMRSIDSRNWTILTSKIKNI
jgi:hypothetical protein